MLQLLQLSSIAAIFHSILVQTLPLPALHPRTRSAPQLAGLEVVHEVGGSLDAGVGELADLLAVEAVPPAAVELAVELADELGVDEVDEGIAHVAGVEVVDWQVEEVDFEPVVAANLLKEHFLRVFVGDVADHEGGASVSLNLHIMLNTLSGNILYSCTSSPAPDLRFLWEGCRW